MIAGLFCLGEVTTRLRSSGAGQTQTSLKRSLMAGIRNFKPEGMPVTLAKVTCAAMTESLLSFQTVLAPQALILLTHLSLASLKTTLVAFLSLHCPNEIDFFEAPWTQTTTFCYFLDLFHIHSFFLRYPAMGSPRVAIPR